MIYLIGSQPNFMKAYQHSYQKEKKKKKRKKKDTQPTQVTQLKTWDAMNDPHKCRQFKLPHKNKHNTTCHSFLNIELVQIPSYIWLPYMVHIHILKICKWNTIQFTQKLKKKNNGNGKRKGKGER